LLDQEQKRLKTLNAVLIRYEGLRNCEEIPVLMGRGNVFKEHLKKRNHICRFLLFMMRA